MRSFRDLRSDYSAEWTETLIKKYPSISEQLAEIVEKREQDIRTLAKSQIKPLQKQIEEIKAQEAAALKRLESVKKLIDSQPSNENKRPL